jgi:DNA-binding NarL/FixJ family response regulator
MRILIIEKQFQTLMSLKSLLSDWYLFAEIHGTGNVCELLHLLEDLYPQIILMDVRIPDSFGMKAIQTIKLKYQSVILIVFALDLTLEAEALSAGADAFICKSDPPEKLREALTIAARNLEFVTRRLTRVQKEVGVFAAN